MLSMINKYPNTWTFAQGYIKKILYQTERLVYLYKKKRERLICAMHDCVHECWWELRFERGWDIFRAYVIDRDRDHMVGVQICQ